jgi:hypothetical protein
LTHGYPMKKKTAATKRTALAKAKPDGLAPLIVEVRRLIEAAGNNLQTQELQ